MKNNLQFRTCCNIDRDIPEAIETKVNNKDYILFGDDNDMPSVYLSCYEDCSILQSIVNSVSDYVAGCGINIEDFVINRKNETLVELLNKLTFDYIVFGAFTIQVIRNKMGEISELNWVDVRYTRLNEEGDKVYYNNNWGKYSRNIKVYDRFQTDVMSNNSIMYVKNTKSRNVYGTPIWSSSLRDVLTLIEASKLNYSDTLNHFTPAVVMSFNNGVPAEDIQDEIEQLVINKFSGSNGNNIMLTWSDDKEHAPEINSFDTNSYTDKYINVINCCKDNILTAFRCSPQLVGITTNTTSFNDVEFTNAFTLWKTTFIKPIQTEIEKAFSRLGINFNFNEFNVEFVASGDVVNI